MNLDLHTLLVGCALVVATATAVFTLTAALRHNDEANRSWVAGFAAALCATGLAAIHGLDDTTPRVVVAAIDASTVFALGALWAGCRLLGARSRSLIGLVLLFAVAVAVPSLVDQPGLALTETLRLGVGGVLAWLGGIELTRGPMRINLNVRIMQGALFAIGSWYVAAAAIFAASDGSAAYQPSPDTTMLPLAGLFLVAAICLSAVRVERAGSWWSVSAVARRDTALTVLASEAFREDARDRIERAVLTGRPAALVLAQIDDLDELNTAFGRDAGDRALKHFSQLLRSHVPPNAVLGHLGAGRFAVLVVTAVPDVPAKVVDAVRTAMTGTSLDEGMEIRMDATFGTSQTTRTVTTFEALLELAVRDLDRSRVTEN